MSSRIQTIDNLTTCYDELEALLDELDPADWEVQSFCPDWTVRGVITHLISLEHALAGWLPSEGDDKPPFHAVGPFVERAGSMSIEELTTEARRVLALRRHDLGAATEEQFARPCMTPVGPGTYNRFMQIRVFDFWVHQRDMTGPLGRPSNDAGPSAEMTLDEIHNSIGYIVGKKIGLPDGMSLAVSLTGPLQRDIYAVVDGRAAKVDHIDDPSVVLTTDSLTFVQLACGRIDPQEQIDAAKISWSGDNQWGEKAARNLAFTM